MKARTLPVLVLLGLCFCLQPIAFASPPDESWLGGFFDDADYDDVVLLVTGGTPATVAVHCVYDLRPAAVVGTLGHTARSHHVAPALSCGKTRAPPSR